MGFFCSLSLQYSSWIVLNVVPCFLRSLTSYVFYSSNRLEVYVCLVASSMVLLFGFTKLKGLEIVVKHMLSFPVSGCQYQQCYLRNQ